MMQVYTVDFEFEYRKGSKERETLIGGFMYAFVFAKDAREVLEKIEHEADKHRVDIVNVEFVQPYKKTFWEIGIRKTISANSPGKRKPQAA
jgi:hypothetical protein